MARLWRRAGRSSPHEDLRRVQVNTGDQTLAANAGSMGEAFLATMSTKFSDKILSSHGRSTSARQLAHNFNSGYDWQNMPSTGPEQRV